MPPKIQQLTAAEKAWIAEQLRRAEDFVRRYADAGQVTIETLEMAWQPWISSGETDTDAINGVINAVGIAFGNALAAVTPLEWVIATDAEGSDLALFAYPGKGDLLIFPANLVAKRWEKKESKFLSSMYSAIVAQVELIGKSQQHGEVPLWKRLLMGPGSR